MKSYILRFSKLILTCFILFTVGVNAQTLEQARKVTASYNTSYLKNLATESLEKSAREKREAMKYAQSRNIPISYTTNEGSFVALQKVLLDGTLIYNTTHNADAAKSTRVNHLNIGGSTGFDLEGQNMVAHVWDYGHPLLTHQEYHGPGGNNRVSVMDSLMEPSSHATHVVGTIVSSGVSPAAKGMAPRSTVKAYHWDNDLSEATEAASSGMLLSNHSYGWVAEDLPAYFFGSYLRIAKDWDNLMFNSPYYLMVISAGNDGDDTDFNSSPLFSGYDMLTGRATAKNNLVVAASDDANVDSHGNLISVDIASFSNPGPTDDLRIKPDITGNGVGVLSTNETSDNAYAISFGTSMSAPNVTGSLLLLQEHYNNINNSFMRAATLKGLALHTADDAGPVGPDARWGWGLLNAKRAAETITQNGFETLIQEMTLTQGETITMQVDSDGINDLVASISWTDRPGVINTQLNSPTPALVNDLDIRVSKDGTTYYPWRLTSATTNSNSGDNKVDPFERVEVEDASGAYTITITHKGNLVGGSQDFSLIVTGLQALHCVPNAIRDTDLGACEYTVVESEFDATFTGVGTITNDFNGISTLAGEVLSPGVTTVIWTISKGSGQTESCTMTITVEDNEAPVISCPSNQTVRIEEGEEYFVVPDYFATGEATAVDNCFETISNVSQNPIPSTELPEGIHTITLNATDDYGNTASCSFKLTVGPTLGGISVADYGTISLYPNPTKDVLIVANPNNILLETIAIFDITGRLVQSIELTKRSSGISIDVSGLSTSTYMVVISGESGKISKRMVKK